MRIRKKLLCFVLSGLCLTACGTPVGEQIQEGAGEMREYRDIAYDTQSEAQKLDLFLPEQGEGPFPLLVFIHGGGWFSGNKQDGQERAWLELLEDGYAVASIEYRLSGEAPHPAGIIDCKTAIRYLKANAEEFQIDSERIAVAGDSSGGHYALMVALTAGNPDFEDLPGGYEEQDSSVDRAAVAVAGEEKVEMDIIDHAEHGDSAFETTENMDRICDFLNEHLQ